MGVGWLLDLQNRDGGWPTFCRGWGTLPFDRSSTDITAHALRAIRRWRDALPELARRIERAAEWGTRYLFETQREDGAWTPLWFGNQHTQEEENATYGTGRVLLSFSSWEGVTAEAGAGRARRGLDWLTANQNDDGGWGGGRGTPSSVEETAIAVEALMSIGPTILYDASTAWTAAATRGLAWLLERVEDGTFADASPIGFYFAKLWYFEKLYPILLTVSALRGALERSRLGA
jgi:squalene-hopene/tetraprenyl-beta-curcumene cyclase